MKIENLAGTVWCLWDSAPARPICLGHKQWLRTIVVKEV